MSGNSHRYLIEFLESRVLLADSTQAMQMFSTSPAVFVENRGQWADPSIRYMHQGSGANVLMTDSGPVFELFKQDSVAAAVPAASGPRFPTPRDDQGEGVLQRTSFSVDFLGANLVSPAGRDPSPTSFNYFIGDQSNWRSSVDGFQKVVYPGLYAGIDLHTWGQRDSLKYEFHVAPGADWRQIALSYDGIEGLSIDGDGSLVVKLADGWAPLRDDAPYVYQQINGRRVEVESSFMLVDEFTYRFEMGRYDQRVELIVDPDLAWATYLGGGDDRGNESVVDATGNVYVTGSTSSSSWATPGVYDPTHNGGLDVFVAKLDSSGSLLYATYLGGDEDDDGKSIAVDSTGNAYVTGLTDSSGWATAGAYDTTFNGNHDIFIAKLNSTGSSLLFATYLGGTSGEYGEDIAVDSAGNAYVTGGTSSSGWATLGAYDENRAGPGNDAFVAKLDGLGSSLLYATYLGGGSGDYGHAISVDSAGNAYIAGSTGSSGLATVGAYDQTFNGGLDAFVAKFNGTGSSLLYYTYIGGSDTDQGLAIAVDSGGNVHLTGQTRSSGWATPGAYDTTYDDRDDVFIAKLNSTGSSLLHATYLGGSGFDGGLSIALDSAGNTYVAGYTTSSGWATAGAYDATYNGGTSDIFMAKLNATGNSLLYATYLGGSSNDRALGIGLDSAGNVYVAGYTGSSGWATPGAYDTTHSGSDDVFVAKFTPGPGIGSSSFEYQTSHQVRIQFSGDVSASLVMEDLTVRTVLADGSLGSPVSVSGFIFDPATHVAIFQLPTSLPDGNYRATIAAGAVTDDFGHPMARDHILNFHVLAADANRDRTVDVRDLYILSQNWLQSGKTFSQGDFNYDGWVNQEDLTVMAQRWQVKVDAPAAPPVASPPLPTAGRRAPIRTPTRVALDILK